MLKFSRRLKFEIEVEVAATTKVMGSIKTKFWFQSELYLALDKNDCNVSIIHVTHFEDVVA